MRELLMATGVALLALAACKQGGDQKDPAAPAAPPATSTATAQALTPDQAFRLAFGTAAPAERTVPGRGSDTEQTYTYTPARLVPLGEVTALISTATNASDCHACAGTLAVHYLTRAGGGWTRTGAWPEIVVGNGFGQPPSFRLRTDLGGGTFIESEAGWSGQGYTCTRIDLIELTPQGAVVRAEGIPTHWDNAGTVDTPRTQDGTLARGPDGKLRVTYTGQKAGFADYELVGGKYVRVSGHDLFEEC